MDKKSPWNTSSSAKSYNRSVLNDISISASDIKSISNKTKEELAEVKAKCTVASTVDKDYLSLVLS